MTPDDAAPPPDQAPRSALDQILTVDAALADVVRQARSLEPGPARDRLLTLLGEARFLLQDAAEAAEGALRAADAQAGCPLDD